MKTNYEYVQFVQLRADFGWFVVAIDRDNALGFISRDKPTDEYMFAANGEILFSADHIADIQHTKRNRS